MRTGTEQEKLKSIAVHTVNEQPVGPDVALPEADIISGESVVTVPVRQSLPGGEPTSDEAADFYLYAVEQLEHHGYRQYEISNFARPGYEGKHNLIYWDCGDYLGIGPAAHSCMGGKRFYYPADTEAFLRDEAAPVMDGGCGAEDYLILQLRLRKGLSLDEYKKRYGREFSTAQLAFVKNCVKSGYANFDGHTLALTPAGLIVQNSILAELL